MPLIERKSKDLIAWEDWQKHLNKKFKIEEPEEVEVKEKEDEKQEEEIVSLEFLEKPIE